MGSAPDAYIAYFQSYTNTYAPLSYLEALFTAAIRHPKIVALSIAQGGLSAGRGAGSCVPRVNRGKAGLA